MMRAISVLVGVLPRDLTRVGVKLEGCYLAGSEEGGCDGEDARPGTDVSDPIAW